MKRIIGFILCTVMFLGLSLNISIVGACADTNDMAYPDAPLYLETVDPNYYGFNLVAETDKLALYIVEQYVNLAVLNKESGVIWSSQVPDPVLKQDGYDPDAPGDNTSQLLYPGTEIPYNAATERFRSIFMITAASGREFSLKETAWYSSRAYTLLCERGGGRKQVNIEGYTSVDYSTVPNGVRVKAHFGHAKIFVVADFYLDAEKETFVAVCEKTDYDWGEEANGYYNYGGEHRTLTMMPFFGAASDRDSGYVFYPDGSGTIAEFTKDHTMTESQTQVMFYAPSVKGASNISALRFAEEDGIMPMLYPVYGMVRNDDAFFAIITDGAESSCLTYAPSGSNSTNYNRIYCTFMLDRILEHYMGVRYTDEVSEEGQLCRIEYHFLTDEDANYSKFVEVYRDYLIENDMFNDAIADDDGMPLALDIFMNTYREGIFGEESVVMTDFDQAYEIIEELSEAGVEDLLLNLSAWQPNGISYGDVATVYSKLGGMDGLKNLTELMNELGFETFMQVNMVEATEDTTKFRITRDAARDYNDLPYINGFYSNSWYMIAPSLMLDRFNDIYLAEFKNSGISGFNYELLGYLLYDFQHDGTHYNKFETRDLLVQVLAESKEEFGKNAVWYGNAYSLKYADWIYDLPSTDTGYANTTRSVPFAQMLLHGYIPYSAIAGNTFYDETMQTLKWIEYGYVPYYMISYEETSKLLDTEMDYLFSTKFSEWSDRIVDKYKLFKEEFGFLYTQTMVAHDQVASNLFVTTYADGTRVYVNYSEFSYKVEGDLVVGAKDYLVVKG